VAWRWRTKHVLYADRTDKLPDTDHGQGIYSVSKHVPRRAASSRLASGSIDAMFVAITCSVFTLLPPCCGSLPSEAPIVDR
jgi:hypothetical protein